MLREFARVSHTLDLPVLPRQIVRCSLYFSRPKKLILYSPPSLTMSMER